MIEVRPSHDDDVLLVRCETWRKCLTDVVFALDDEPDDTTRDRLVALIDRAEPEWRAYPSVLYWPARFAGPTWEDAEWR